MLLGDVRAEGQVLVLAVSVSGLTVLSPSTPFWVQTGWGEQSPEGTAPALHSANPHQALGCGISLVPCQVHTGLVLPFSPGPS